MNGWMIAVDGSAVNLAHVTHVLAEKRASHVDDTWFVMARPAGVALATGLASREAAVAWVETHFRSAPKPAPVSDGAQPHGFTFDVGYPA